MRVDGRRNPYMNGVENHAARRVKQLNRAVYHNLWYFWARVLATWVATGHYHAKTTAGMLMVVGETVSEP